MTAHEADMSSRGIRAEAEFLDESNVEPWGVEPAAGDGDQMSNITHVLIGLSQRLFAGMHRKSQGMLLVLLHPFARRGAAVFRGNAWLKEVGGFNTCVDRFIQQHGAALLDPGSLVDQLHHPPMIIRIAAELMRRRIRVRLRNSSFGDCGAQARDDHRHETFPCYEQL